MAGAEGAVGVGNVNIYPTAGVEPLTHRRARQLRQIGAAPPTPPFLPTAASMRPRLPHRRPTASPSCCAVPTHAQWPWAPPPPPSPTPRPPPTFPSPPTPRRAPIRRRIARDAHLDRWAGLLARGLAAAAKVSALPGCAGGGRVQSGVGRGGGCRPLPKGRGAQQFGGGGRRGTPRASRRSDGRVWGRATGGGAGGGWRGTTGRWGVRRSRRSYGNKKRDITESRTACGHPQDIPKTGIEDLPAHFSVCSWALDGGKRQLKCRCGRVRKRDTAL